MRLEDAVEALAQGRTRRDARRATIIASDRGGAGTARLVLSIASRSWRRGNLPQGAPTAHARATPARDQRRHRAPRAPRRSLGEIADRHDVDSRCGGRVRRHERAREAEARGLGQAPIDLRHRAHLATEAELPDRDGVAARSAVPGARSPPRARPRGRCRSRRSATRRRCSRRRRRRRAARRCAGRAPRGAGRGDRRRARAPTAAVARALRARRGPAPRRASGARPSSTAATTEPGTSSRRSTRKRADASGTSARPTRGHLEQPELVGAPEPVLQRVEQAQRVAAIAVDREHGVDDVLEHPRPRERAFLRDVTDEHRGELALLGLLHEPVGAVAHLGDRARRAGRSGSSTVWIESSASICGRDRPRRARRRGAATSRRRRAGRARARRPARRGVRTCAHDSSAVTSRHRVPRAAIRPSAWSSSVLLPIPGSPTSRVTEPGNQPTAEHAVELTDPGGHRRRRARAHLADRDGPIGRAIRPAPSADRRRSRRVGRPTRRACPTRRTLGHRPSQRGDSSPHSRHRCTVRVRHAGDRTPGVRQLTPARGLEA